MPAKAKKTVEKDAITKDMTIGDVVAKYPEAAHVMIQGGLHCIGCRVAMWETIEQGAKAHGLTDDEIKKMVRDMNLFIKADKKK